MEAIKRRDVSAYAVARRRMVEEQLIKKGIVDPRVLEAMGRVPRHLFVAEALQDQAYEDHAIGIGEGQTISQPYTVALMTQSLNLKGGEKILEIGTGCGYQTAVLCEMGAQVYTIERIKNLAFMARRVFKDLGLRKIVMRVGDGTQGWPEGAPFDGILSAASSPQIPEPLFRQLGLGGRLLVPVGDDETQNLMRVTRTSGEPLVENLGDCRFVKLVGRFGWAKQRKAGDKFTKRSLV